MILLLLWSLLIVTNTAGPNFGYVVTDPNGGDTGIASRRYG